MVVLDFLPDPPLVSLGDDFLLPIVLVQCPLGRVVADILRHPDILFPGADYMFVISPLPNGVSGFPGNTSFIQIHKPSNRQGAMITCLLDLNDKMDVVGHDDLFGNGNIFEKTAQHGKFVVCRPAKKGQFQLSC